MTNTRFSKPSAGTRTTSQWGSGAPKNGWIAWVRNHLGQREQLNQRDAFDTLLGDINDHDAVALEGFSGTIGQPVRDTKDELRHLALVHFSYGVGCCLQFQVVKSSAAASSPLTPE